MQRVLHALDLGILGDWEGAKRSLEELGDEPIVARLVALMTEEQRREKQRSQALTLVRHELGNALSIAQANVEAMVDGLLEPTLDRLCDIRDALQTCGSLVVDLKNSLPRSESGGQRVEAFNICDLIATQADLVSAIAESKSVRITSELCRINDGSCIYHGDADATAHAIRHVLLSAVRFSPPGGEIRLGCVHPNNELLLSMRNAAIMPAANGEPAGMLEKLLQKIGGDARIVHQDSESASFFISLPAVTFA
jgi:two-component system sensor histidine kinase BaeS